MWLTSIKGKPWLDRACSNTLATASQRVHDSNLGQDRHNRPVPLQSPRNQGYYEFALFIDGPNTHGK